MRNTLTIAGLNQLIPISTVMPKKKHYEMQIENDRTTKFFDELTDRHVD